MAETNHRRGTAMDFIPPLNRYTCLVLLMKMEDGMIKFYLARKKQDIHTNGETLEDSKKMNTYGGKLAEVDNGSMFACSYREVLGECNVRIINLTPAGKIQVFKGETKSEVHLYMEVHLFISWEYEGIPVETDEMGAPILYSFDTAPYDDMMPADKPIFSTIKSGMYQERTVIYTKDKKGERVVDYGPLSITTPKVPFF